MTSLREPRRRGRAGWLAFALLAGLLVLWLVWGFRWPPTAEVVVEPEPALGLLLDPDARASHGSGFAALVAPRLRS